MANEILETSAGELVQTWWCQDCQEWHTDSLLGGPITEKEADK